MDTKTGPGLDTKQASSNDTNEKGCDVNRENDDDEEKEGEDTDVDDYDYCGEFYNDDMNVCGKKHMLKKYVQN